MMTEPSPVPSPEVAHIPMVYVKDALRWEYEQRRRDLDEQGPLDVEALNELGAQGWELAGILTHGRQAIYIFKRIAD